MSRNFMQRGDDENVPLNINTMHFNQNITKMELMIEQAYKEVVTFGSNKKSNDNTSQGEIGGGGNFVKI